MSISGQIDKFIAEEGGGNVRDALNVALAKLSLAERLLAANNDSGEESNMLMNMQLHEFAETGDGSGILRVLGGWIYTVNGTASCFVPEPSKPIFAELSATEEESPVFVMPDGAAIDMRTVDVVQSLRDIKYGDEYGVAFSVRTRAGSYQHRVDFTDESEREAAYAAVSEIQKQAVEAFQKFAGKN